MSRSFFRVGIALTSTLFVAGCESAREPGVRTVQGIMQPRPGAAAEDVEVAVHPVPVDPPSVPAEKARLPDDDLVLGIVVAGEAMAYPIRFLALTEVVNDRVGGLPLAPTW